MRVNYTNDNKSTVFYIKVFFWVVILIVLISLFARFINLALNSSFKNNSFSILYISKDSKIISVDEKSKTVSFLSIGDVRNIIKGKTPFVASVALGMPINGILIDENKSLNPNYSEFISFGNEARLILSFKTTFRNFNEFDLHKIMSIARGADKDNIKDFKIDLLKDNLGTKELESAFQDKTIIDSEMSVEVVNGTEVNGLASSVAAILSKKGYNVVFLQTINGSFDENSYIGYKVERNNYIDSLEKLTRFEEKGKTISGTADVTIYLGRDLETQFSD